MKSAAIILSLIAVCSSLPRPELNVNSRPEVRDPREVRMLITSNDFEDDRMSPWYDQSSGQVRWGIEDYTNPSQNDIEAPKPGTGTKYLRGIRSQLVEGTAVLRSEPFTASPGDQISFSFWIQSRRTGVNNIALDMLIGKNDTTLIELSSFSSPSNFEWRNVDPIPIPVSEPTTIELIFYGFCGFGAEDAIAIDNIMVQSNDNSSTTTTQQQLSSSTTVPTTITVSQTSSEPTTSSSTEVITTTSTSTSSPSTTTISITTTRPPGSCEYVFSSQSEIFSSPNYPDHYGNSLDCRYYIDVPSGRINLVFADFETEATFDFVKVYDGLSYSSSPLLLTASGDKLPSSVISSGPQMLIRFTTDDSNGNFKGFKAIYSRLQ